MDGVYFYLVEREDESQPMQQKMLQNGVLPLAVLFAVIVPICTKVNFICSPGKIPTLSVCCIEP